MHRRKCFGYAAKPYTTGIIVNMSKHELNNNTLRRAAESPLERLIAGADNALRTLNRRAPQASRPSPALGTDEKPMTDSDKRHAVGLMRINHAGEVAAQGLYQGHALVARDPQLHDHLQHAAEEEFDHLAWCHERLEQLDAPTSRLNPLWYGGAYLIGAASGLAGDRWGLGFIDETEKQVVDHISDHLTKLPLKDERSRKVLGTMRQEEAAHGANARDQGAAKLPAPVRGAMRLAAGVMKAAAYRF